MLNKPKPKSETSKSKIDTGSSSQESNNSDLGGQKSNEQESVSHTSNRHHIVQKSIDLGKPKSNKHLTLQKLDTSISTSQEGNKSSLDHVKSDEADWTQKNLDTQSNVQSSQTSNSSKQYGEKEPSNQELFNSGIDNSLKSNVSKLDHDSEFIFHKRAEEHKLEITNKADKLEPTPSITESVSKENFSTGSISKETVDINPASQESTETSQESACSTEPVSQESACSTEPVSQESACSTEPVSQESACSTEPVSQESVHSTGHVSQESVHSTEPVSQESVHSTEPVSQESACSTESVSCKTTPACSTESVSQESTCSMECSMESASTKPFTHESIYSTDSVFQKTIDLTLSTTFKENNDPEVVTAKSAISTPTPLSPTQVTNSEPIAKIAEPILSPKISLTKSDDKELNNLTYSVSEESLINNCNEKWLDQFGFILEKNSDICYKLSNKTRDEIYIIFITPVCYPNNIYYELNVKEVYYPHTKTLAGFQNKMSNHGLNISVVNNTIIQFGKESNSIYIYIKDAKFYISNTIDKALRKD